MRDGADPRRAPTPVPPITFPEALPVSARRDEIAVAIAAHPVVIVSGETGSGKTTQLPKIALALGRGRGAGGRGLIGHTQPRRLAASSVAKRIADELGTPPGEVVGYKVRFQDRLAPGASVKLMTDGILLAETQGDPLLRAYDTLIVDEAHERSLNIDFLLGYLAQLLPKRPDLKVIVTSATIDAERFARHFAQPVPGSDTPRPAPVIHVSGRLYPVEVRWRPIEAPARAADAARPAAGDAPLAAAPTPAASRRAERDLNLAIADAVDELWRGGPSGDILVFLPGEREIRDAADHLHRHWHAPRAGGASRGPAPEVLPLYARLSQAEQDRVFTGSTGRRIVLATNVAETSLTVPGVRYVVDSGLARVKRYSFRHKVEQLQVEPISQAAANQRAGRCGRVADGVCIRLYDEAGFAARPRFTDPEILRSSLAGVILRMKSLALGEVEAFPFLEAPKSKAIADGYALLNELGAVDDERALTPIGQALARLPLDPRIGRMILAARERDCLDEMLVIASALSVQDVRDRPAELATQADQKHKPFDDDRSEFVGTLKLWRWLDGLRSGHEVGAGAAEGRSAATHKLSHRQFDQRLREHFISPRRVREWRDTHQQLHALVAEQGWRTNGAPATYEQLHMALLAGLLGNLGCKSDTEDWYLGARGIKFWRHPGANLGKKPGRWIVAAELVETTRLYARGIAAIDPAWLPPVAGHLLRTQLLDPHWEKGQGEVVALERATLYGLVVYAGRKVNYGRVAPAEARELFIRHALVDDDWDAAWPFLAHNRKLVAQIEQLEHKRRRQDVLVDDALIFAVYDKLLPPEVHSASTFERWFRHASRADPKLLQLSRDDLMRHEAAGVTTAAFPRFVRLGGIDCATTYLHEPGDARDGVTVTVPLVALNQVAEERCEWLVPGMLDAKVQALAKTLPGKPRARLQPVATFAADFVERHAERFGDGSLIDAFVAAVRERTQLPTVTRADVKLDQLAPHHFMNLRVVDEHGRQLAMGRHVPALKAQWGAQARTAFQALATLKVRDMTATEAAAAGAPPSPATTVRAAPPQTPAPGTAASPASSRTAAPKASSGTAATPGSARTSAPWSPSGPAASPGSARAAAQPTATGMHHEGDARAASPDAAPRLTAWTFGELPELLEVRRGAATLVGFPALVDHGDHVTIEVFDEPDVAQRRHRLGLRRLVALQLREPLKHLPKSLPDALKLAALYLPLGNAEALTRQILDAAVDRAFLAEPLPHDAASFDARLAQGRPRLGLIAQELARLALAILTEWAAATRKLKDSRAPKDVADDIAAQLQRLVGADFIAATLPSQLAHLPRYLKGIQARLDKWRTDPTRDAQRLAELRPLEARWLKRAAERRGTPDARLDEYRWLLEELRVSLFAQELRTPQPVSVKRLDKAWGQMQG